MQFVLTISIMLALVGLFFLLAAAASFAYPQSRTTVEVYPIHVRPPRQWLKIIVFFGVSMLLVVLAAYLFWEIFLPGQRLEEVEAVTYKSFKEKLGRRPTKLHLEEEVGTEWAHWKYKGTAWLEDAEVWEVTVTWSTNAWECKAARRE